LNELQRHGTPIETPLYPDRYPISTRWRQRPRFFLEPARTPILFLLEPARTPILFRLVSGTEGLGAGLTLGSSSCALQKRIQSSLPPSNATADLGQYSTVLPLFKFNSTGCILSYVFL
jgi:hypothetical protein